MTPFILEEQGKQICIAVFFVAKDADGGTYLALKHSISFRFFFMTTQQIFDLQLSSHAEHKCFY